MLEGDLRGLIARKEVVLVVGTGVSVSATGNAPTASWKGLLLSGVKWCQGLKPDLPARWVERRNEDLEQGTTAEMIAAADLITDELRSVSPGEFEKWLEEKVGALRIKDRSVLEALIGLGLPFTTTNYDHLLEEATAQPPVSWTEPGKVERLFRSWNSGSFQMGVIHLHGSWDQPESVVLGVKSYEAVKNDEPIRTLLKSLRLGRSLLFVGCADGLSDPNFGNFLTWTRSVFADSPFRQFCLVRESEREKLQAQHPSAERLFFLSYGEEFKDLVPFLKTLVPKKPRPARRTTTGAKKLALKRTPLSPAVTGYLRRLAEETRYLRMIGLSENLQIDLEIKDAYVPLRTVVARSLTGKPHGRFSQEELKEAGQVEVNLPLSEMFTVASGYEKRGIILLGEPGAGKTTGARQLCWRLASGEQSPADLGLPRGLVPVFLRFRNLQDDRAEKGFKDFVLRETRDEDAPEAEAHPGLELWNGQPRLWVFDGLDEVVSEAVRIQVCQRLQDFLRHRPRDYVLVTSRYQGYGQKVDLGPGYIQFHVQPLKPDQVEAFVDKWFRAAYQQLYRDKPKAQKEATADAGNLRRILNQNEYTIGGLRELRTNPLLLTVVCLVYHQEHSLPRGRAALYEKCVTVLLESWRKGLYDRQRAKTYDPRAAQRVLAQLAWWMHCQGEGEAGRKDEREEDRRGSPSAGIKEMAEAVAKPLAETAQGAGLGRDGQRFIERMRDESGILVTAKPGCCSFLHLTFQEYLAATHAVEEGRSRELVERLDKSWWREVILLALARANGPFAKEFFAAFLESPAWEADLGFASRCLDESAVTILDPFLDKLRSEKTLGSQKSRILQLLRQKDDPALLEVCLTLAGSAEPQIASAAREILERAKVAGKVEVVEAEPVPAIAAAKPGEISVDPRSGIAFVFVPGGEFDMGSTTGQDWEKPIHRVRISALRLGRYAVTNQEYERFLKETKSKNVPSEWDNKNFNQPQQPVVGVSWEDAQGFCQWAGCRLPTEAEWEYACRAGTTTAFYFGDSLSSRQANFDGNHPYGKAEKGPYLQKTSPVGSYEPNSFGLYDMHGNVWEWCQDWHGKYPKGPVIDPTGPEQGRIRVLRGGCWSYSGGLCRSAFRDGDHPSLRYLNLGFRVVLAPRSGEVRTASVE
jgi:formylglycine-generating enzyme required for sulfatase activity